MRTAPVLVAAVLLACFACTYDIPDLETQPDAAGDEPSEASTEDSGSGSGSSSGSDADGGHPVDSSTMGDGSCTGALCPCASASDCASHVCALSETVGSALYQAAGGAGFCTEPCCTSVDCPTGTACFASGVGGNYCVDPARLGRSSTLGGIGGGASCTSNAQCRSGLCASQRCADTCCSFEHSAAECASGSQCGFGNFPGSASLDTHFTARCGPPGGANTGGAPCDDSGQCAGGLCYTSSGPGYCVQPCGSSGECASGSGCQLDFQGSDMYFACFPWPGNDAEDTPCDNDMQCVGGWCSPTNLCTNVCFTSASCVPGWTCAPEEDVFSSQTYLVLVCGP